MRQAKRLRHRKVLKSDRLLPYSQTLDLLQTAYLTTPSATKKKKFFQRRFKSFVFIQKVFLESEYPMTGDDPATDKKGAVEKSVLKDLFALLAIDAKKTATVIYYHMYPFIPLVSVSLNFSSSLSLTFWQNKLVFVRIFWCGWLNKRLTIFLTTNLTSVFTLRTSVYCCLMVLC